MRRQLDHERWVNRGLRQRQFFGDYYWRPVVVYQDHYSHWFWWWLLAQSLDTRAHWAYNHRYSMDAARYQELLSRDRQLEARIRQLEAQNLQRNTQYTPSGLDNDLMYSNEYVDAVYNPQPDPTLSSVPPVSQIELSSHPPRQSGGSGRAFLKFIIVLAVIGFLVWIVFFKRWS